MRYIQTEYHFAKPAINAEFLSKKQNIKTFCQNCALFSDKISYLDISKLLFIIWIELNLQSKFLNKCIQNK